MTDNEKFFAWLDGELSDDEAAEMERQVANDPDLRKLAEEHRAMQARLSRAFDPIAEAEVPERLLSAISEPHADVIDFAQAKQSRAVGKTGTPYPRWAAMAATLVAGVIVGTMVPRQSSTPLTVHNGQVYAASALDEALNTELASAPASAAARIGVTFRDQSGAICRSFMQPRASGLACRAGDRWQVRGLFAAPEGQSADYRMAAGVDPSLAAIIDSTIAGEPFDAAEEQAARTAGWR